MFEGGKMSSSKHIKVEKQMIDDLLKRMGDSRKLIELDAKIRPKIKELRGLQAKKTEACKGSEEEKTLENSIKGQRNSIIIDNMWFAEELAKQIPIEEMEEEDKISYAYMGLVMAVDNYNVVGRKKFTQQCASYILENIKSHKQSIEKDLDNHKNSKDLILAIDIIKQTEIQLQQELFKEHISAQEIAERTQFPVDLVKELMEIIDYYENTQEESLEQHLSRTNQQRHKIVDGIYQEEQANDNVRAFVSTQGVRNKNTEYEAMSGELSKLLHEILASTLTEREKFVISERYGLKDGQTKTVEEIRREVDSTPTLIKQIEAKGNKKLRDSEDFDRLRTYVDMNIDNKEPNSGDMIVDNGTITELERLALRKLLKEIKIPEKQRLQKEYKKLTEEKLQREGEKSDK